MEQQYALSEKMDFLKSLFMNDLWILIPKICNKLGFRFYRSRVVHGVYAGRRLLSNEEFNQEVIHLLNGDKPVMISRMGGGTELTLVDQYLKKTMGFQKEIDKKYISRIHNLSGVFPENAEIVEEFCSEYLRSISQIDICGLWLRYCDNFILGKYLPKAQVTLADNIEPYYASEPWTQALEGKRVLVIHPFEKTIRQQYQIREKLFEDPRLLPDFELLTVQAVQSIAGNKPANFDNWFEALDYMYQEAMKRDFDVAIIGCGAYAVPLAAKIKQAGKKAIVTAGATQIMFGIKGARWDTMPEVNKYYNEYWTRPLDSDKPENFQIVESGCYW